MLGDILRNPEQDLIKLVSILKRKILDSTSKLKESEERYRSLIEGLNIVGIGIDIVDQDYNVLYQNDVLKQRFGSITNALCFEKYMGVEKPCDFCPMIKAIKNKVVESVELKAGDGRNYKLISAPYPNIDGTVDKAVEVVLDITEQKEMEKEFKESEEKFRTITEQSLMGIGILQDNFVKYATKKLAEIYGYTVEEMLNFKPGEFLTLIAPESLSLVREQARKKQSGEKDIIIHYEAQCIKKTGERFWVENYSKSINYNGRPADLVTNIDITERKTVEEAFLIEKEFTETTLSAQRDTFFIFEPSTGKAVRWNKAFKDVSGYNNDEISNLKAPESYYNDNDLINAAKATEIVGEEGEVLFEMNLITKDGRSIPFEYLGSRINDDEGNLKYIVSAGRNITERKKVEKKLRESEELLKKAQQMAHIGHWYLNPTTMEVTGSDELFRIFELNHNESTLEAFAGVVHPDDREYDLSHINRGLEHGESWDIEHRLLLKDGKVKWIHAIGEAFLDETGKVDRLLGTVQDITERKKVEEILYQEQDLIRTLLENHPDFIYFKDSEARFMHISKPFCEFFGRKEEDIIGKTDLDLFPKEVSEQTHREDISIIKTGIPLINKEENSGTTWVLTTKIPWLDQNGSIKGLFGISHNITQRKKAEQKLKESEAKLRGIMNSITDQVCVIGRDLDILYINSVTEGIYGPSALGGKCYQVYHGYDKPCGDCQVKESFEDGETHNKECIRRINEESRYCWCVSNVFERDEEENPITVVEVSRDITERRKIEQELKESEEKFRTISEESLVGITIIQDDIVKYVNQEGANIFGHSVEDIKSWKANHYLDLLHPEQRANIGDNIKKNEIGSMDIGPTPQIKSIKKGDDVVWLDNFSKTITFNGRTAELSMFVDITEKKKAEEELLKLNRLKSELLSRASHELKTPLSSIKGYLEFFLLKYKDILDHESLSILEQIKMGSFRLENLVKDIINAGELQSGAIKLKKSEEDLSILIINCINDLKDIIDLRNHSIELKIQENMRTSIESGQIYNVVSNLLSNAIKYTPPNGNIEIKSEISVNSIIISITDNGIGFTDEEKLNVFKQFGKIEHFGEGMDVITEGAGLGLYLSKMIVELHGGEVWIESEGRNKGATLSFSLPII